MVRLRNGVENLVERAKKYDSQAFGKLYDLYVNQIYNYAYYKIGDPAEAEDLTEQVFVKALEAIKSFKQKKAPFSAWLFRIAHNLIVDYYRTRSKMTTVSINNAKDILALTSSESIEQAVIKKFSREKLYIAISRLTEEQQETIILKFLANLSNSEIARILHKSEGAVKSLQHRALNSLARILKGESESGT